MSTRIVGITLFGLALMALVLVPGLFETLFGLVFLGMVPFTNYSLPPLVMLATYSLLLALSIRWLFVQPVLIPDPKRRDAIKRATARKRVLKKTARLAAHKSTPKKHRHYHQTVKAKA